MVNRIVDCPLTGRCRVAHALRHYQSGASWEVARWERNLKMLSERHRALVPRLADKARSAPAPGRCRLPSLASGGGHELRFGGSCMMPGNLHKRIVFLLLRSAATSVQPSRQCCTATPLVPWFRVARATCATSCTPARRPATTGDHKRPCPST